MLTSRRTRTGLVLLALLSVGDLVAPLLTDGEHPPMAIAVAGSVLGLVSLLLVVAAWRGSHRAVLPLVVVRALSALSAVPAFFASDVPAAAVAGAGAGVAITAVGIALVLPAAGRRSVAAIGAR